MVGLGASPSPKTRLDLNKRRSRLQTAVDAFNNEASRYLPDYLREWISEGPDVAAEDAQYMSLLDEDPDLPVAFVLPKVFAENKFLCFPSTLGAEALKAAGFNALIEKELMLRKGQANDSLQGVRTSLGEKSFLFRHDLRLADSKVKKTKAWTRLVTVNKKVNRHRWVYEKSRAAMIRLGADTETMQEYRTLTRDDCRVSTAVMMPNKSGERDAKLAWFWTLRPPESSDHTSEGQSGGELLNEGKQHSNDPDHTLTISASVYRIHWLRANSRAARWEEELRVTGYEMVWTSRFFLHKSEQWLTEVDGPNSVTEGHKGYARRQSAFWRNLSQVAWAVFKDVNPTVTEIFGAITAM